MRKKIKYYPVVLAGLLILFGQPVWAAGPAQPSLSSNPLTVSLLALMVVLLIIIGVLANILLGVAHIRVKKEKKKNEIIKIAASIAIAFALSSNSLFAQDGSTVGTAADTIGGMSSSVFYILASVIFLELLVILVLLLNVRVLLKVEKEKLATEVKMRKVKKPFVSLWNSLNSFRPAEQEADIDLGHDYDGIRELDNRLPPWWIYGFYLTIIIAGVYLWRFHISHTGQSSKEEYEASVSSAEHEIKEYLAKKGESVDENTVTILSASSDIAAGKAIFISSCVACHKESGGGDVGPNLTDDYWIHGGDIKSVFKTIRYGINAMPQWQNSYSNKQIAQVASYVKALQGTNPPNPKAPQGELYKDEKTPAKPVADSTTVKESKLTMN